MLKVGFWTLTAVSMVLTQTSSASPFADAVVDYNPGTGFATDWVSGAGITNASAALGMPSVQTVDPDPFWGGTFPVTPFSPAYLANQVVSIGTNGSLTVRFNTPILNTPGNPFGLDFIIYGNSGFMDVDWPNGLADDSGTLLGHNRGNSRVSVSADGSTYYSLQSSLAPMVDVLFPTDGQGTFGLPVNPALTGASFANLSLAQIRALYAGSAGGAGYDLGWAVDGGGQPVSLGSVQYVRVEVLNGVAEIDGFAVVPEPATWTLLGLAGAAGLGWRRRRRS